MFLSLKKQKNWYLPLNEYEDFLNEWIIEGHKDDWKPNVYGQVKSWLNDGLKPRAMTRDLNWEFRFLFRMLKEKYYMYGLMLLSGIFLSPKNGQRKTEKTGKTIGRAPESDLVHFIGKDNIVFHCIIFPSMMKAHGDYIMPANVPAFEFLNLENDKISTSRNWAVWAHEYVEDFPDSRMF